MSLCIIDEAVQSALLEVCGLKSCLVPCFSCRSHKSHALDQECVDAVQNAAPQALITIVAIADIISGVAVHFPFRIIRCAWSHQLAL
jgi:hypothetical protein